VELFQPARPVNVDARVLFWSMEYTNPVIPWFATPVAVQV